MLKVDAAINSIQNFKANERYVGYQSYTNCPPMLQQPQVQAPVAPYICAPSYVTAQPPVFVPSPTLPQAPNYAYPAMAGFVAPTFSPNPPVFYPPITTAGIAPLPTDAPSIPEPPLRSPGIFLPPENVEVSKPEPPITNDPKVEEPKKEQK